MLTQMKSAGLRDKGKIADPVVVDVLHEYFTREDLRSNNVQGFSIQRGRVGRWQGFCHPALKLRWKRGNWISSHQNDNLETSHVAIWTRYGAALHL